MGSRQWWLCLCVLGILAVQCLAIRQCLEGITINVILPEDEESPWSLKYVRDEIGKAIQTENSVNVEEGNKLRNTT